ncbi:MAG: serine/threonine protein kinase [Vulcanimicrobiota bacterium]
MKEDLTEGTKLQKDRYEIIRLLGSSEYSKVYMAKDHKMLKSRIIKEIVFPDDAEEIKKCREHFEKESKQILPLKHNTLPRYFDFFEENESFFLVREFVEGKTLDQHLAKIASHVPEKQYQAWAAQICDIFIYLHSQDPPLLFGSLRPENLIVTPMGKIRVMDFGTDRFYPHHLRKPILKKFSHEFLAPELLGGEEVSIKSDIFNLGALLYFLLTGVRPVSGALNFQVRAGEKPDSFKPFEDPIKKGLSQDKDSRYSAVIDFKRGLLGEEAALGGPRIEIDTPQLNYVDTPEGRMVQGSFNIKNTGGGVLAGRIIADVSWVRVFPEYFNQNNQSVEFNVHTNDLPQGATHTAIISITTPTEMKKVPIEIALHAETTKSISDIGVILLLLFVPIINGPLMLLYRNHVSMTFQNSIRGQFNNVPLEAIEALKISAFTFPQNMMNSLYLMNSLFLIYAVLCPVYMSLIFYSLLPQQQKRYGFFAAFLTFLPIAFLLIGTKVPLLMPNPLMLQNEAIAGYLSLNQIFLQFIALNALAGLNFSLYFIDGTRQFVMKNNSIPFVLIMIITLLLALFLLLIEMKSKNTSDQGIVFFLFLVISILLPRKPKPEEKEQADAALG